MTNQKKIEWVLRLGVAGEFLGHGMLAIAGKADWVKWINELSGIELGLAAQLLTLIGVMDVILALIVLFRPVRPLLLWMTFWGFWTALVRPLVGQSGWDFIERFANWAAPLALWYLMGNRGKNA